VIEIEVTGFSEELAEERAEPKTANHAAPGWIKG
jgi:hypothetical protein